MSNHANFISNRRQEAELRAISKSTSSHTTSVDSLKTLQTKTFTNGTDPTEIIAGGSSSDKQYSVVGGVDLSNGSFSKINPVKVDDNGLLECKVIGNTSADGTGTAHHIHVDSNGNARVSLVSSVNVLPADALNGDTQNDPANSVAVSLKGRTDIADASTSKFLKCDTNGNLELNDATNGSKLDDIKNGQTQNGDGTGNKLGVMVDAINTNTITQNSKIDSTNTKIDTVNTNLGDIETEVAKTQTVVHTSSFPSMASNTASSTIDLGVNYFRFQKLKIAGNISTSAPVDLFVQISNDAVNFFTTSGIAFVSPSGTGSLTAFFNHSIDNPMRYWRFYNNSTSATGVIDNVIYRVNQM